MPAPEPPAEQSFFRHGKRLFAEAPTQGALTAGRVIGDFRLVRKLGEGGMGQVWEAVQLTQDRSVALKLMSSDRVLSEMNLALFEREAQAVVHQTARKSELALCSYLRVLRCPGRTEIDARRLMGWTGIMGAQPWVSRHASHRGQCSTGLSAIVAAARMSSSQRWRACPA